MKRALYVPLAAAGRRLVAALLPGACALCGAHSRDALCDGCATCLSDSAIRCPQCGVPVDVGTHVQAVCGRCIARPPAFDATLCVAGYDEPADSLATGLKFRGQLALAALFGASLATRAQQQQVALPELIVPIPLSPARLATRGYNQAWEIARVTARRLGRPARARCLVRTRDTPAQSGLRGADRWRNMRRAFAVADADRVRGAHIGLVDDVMTSGATLDAAARALKRAGAARVTVFVVLRTSTP